MTNIQERAQYYLVDSRGEGGLVSELDRVAMVDQPVLIIGLGGTGIDAMLNAKYVLHRKLQQPKGEKRPGRLAFLGIDTDTSDLDRKRVGDTRVDESERCDIAVPTLKTLMANKMLITNEYERDWLSEGIPKTIIENGAGGVRQYGRFMLIHSADKVVSMIQSTVSQMLAAGKENGAAFGPDDMVNVYILTGISGGTGSGTFLDMAYLVHEVIKNHMHRPVRVRGIVFMPDVNLCAITTQSVREYVPVNGYAALKELDYWMNLQRGRNFTQQYTTSVKVDTDEAPFEQCFLISPNGSMSSDYTDCMRTTGEALLNILSAPEAGVPGFESFVVNLVAMLPHVKKPYSGNYVYASMGMDERRMQLDQMANYIAYYLLSQVQRLFANVPTKDEVNKFVRAMRLDHRGMEGLFNKGVNARPYNNMVSLEGFKEIVKGYNKKQVLDEDLLESELKLWAEGCDAFYQKRWRDLVDDIMALFISECDRRFADQDIGPFHTHKLLHNLIPGAPDVLKALAEAITALETDEANEQQLRENKQRDSMNAKQGARNCRYVPLMAGPKYDDYIEAVFDLYNFDRVSFLNRTLKKVYRELSERITRYNNQVVEAFVTMLNELTGVFKANSDIITTVTSDSGNHTWNISNFKDVQPLIDEAIDAMSHEGKTKDLVHEFLEMILKEQKAWLEEDGDLGGSFSRFVSQKFGDIMDLTMEIHYKKVLGFDINDPRSDQQLRDHLTNVVLPQLQAGSKVMYTPNSVLCDISNAAHRSMISYPAVATQIGQAVNAYKDDHHIDCDIVPSQRRGSLFWFEATFGMPMYAFNAIVNYQKAYDHYGADDAHLGRHLKMSAKEDWSQILPSVLPDSMWDYAQYKDAVQASRNERSRSAFEKGWQLELLKPLVGGAGKFVLAEVDAAGLEKLMADSVLTSEERARLLTEGIAAAADINADRKAVAQYVTRAKAFLKDGWISTKKIFKDDVFQLLPGGVTVEPTPGEKRSHQVLSENLIWTPDLSLDLEKQVGIKEQLMEVIKAHEVYMAMGDAESAERKFFANALFYGLYKKIPPRVYQLDVTGAGVQAFVLMSLNDYAVAPKEKYYAIFRKFQSLTPAQKATMQAIIDQRTKLLDQEMQLGNVERYTQYITTLQGINDEIAKRLGEIDMDISFDGPQIREFYSAMLEEFMLWLAE